MLITAIMALIGLLLVVNILIVRPHWWIGLIVLATAATLPVQIPTAIPLGGFGVNISEIALVAGALYVLGKYPGNRLSDSCAVAVFAVTALFALIGLTNSFPINHVAIDSRGLLTLAIALFIAGRISQTPLATTAVKSVRVTLWLSLFFIALGAVGLARVEGRSTDASLSGAGAAPTDVTRILSPTTHLAATVVGICLGLAVTKPGTFRSTLSYLIPALGITFFAYSRNALAIVAIAVFLTPLLERQVRAWLRVVFAGAGLAIAYYVSGWILPQLSDLPGLGYLNKMYSAYAHRVIGGLSTEAQQVDSSVLYRQLEIGNMKTSISGNELFGHGLGYSYQAQRDRNTPTSAFYGHQFYFWAVVKTGFVGILVYLAALAAPIIRAIRRPGNAFCSACVAAAVGLLYISTVAPIPVSTNGGPLLGVLLGIAATRWNRREDAGLEISAQANETAGTRDVVASTR
ncbi:hypothetical protein Rruber_02658 [Rhodococcus ruber]|uniref:hypothetical protein n=1 Tax=Rhodococcus ruber TaxID=1830 RepID=UPI00315D1D6C